MKKIFILAVFGVVFFVLTGNCFAQKGFSFFKPKNSEKKHLNIVLSNLVESSLKKDSSGLSPIKGTVATSPAIFFEAIKRNHPTVLLFSLEDLPEYLRRLVCIFSRSDGVSHHLARIIREKKVYIIDSVGFQRKFHPKELIWFDSQNGENILAGDCSNIIIPEKSSPKKVLGKKNISPNISRSEFEFCSDFVGRGFLTPTPPFRVCSATKFVQLRYPGEMVPVIYGICDANNSLVYSRNAEILIEDYSAKGDDLVQKNRGLFLVKNEGCTQVLIKRGNNFQTFKPFDSDKTDGEKNEILFSVEGTREPVKPLLIPWAVNVKKGFRNGKTSLKVFQKGDDTIAMVASNHGNFVTGVLRLIVEKGRREIVLVRTNFQDVLKEGKDREIFNFGKLPKGNYLVTFSQPELIEGGIYLKEKNIKEIKIKN